MKPFKSMETTFIYKHLNDANDITGKISAAFKDGKVLKKENLEEALLLINKNFKFPLKFKVMEAFESGELILLYSPNNIKVPTTVPFVLTKNANNGVVAVVFVDLYGKLNEETGVVNVDAKKLYCIMEAALLGITFFRNHNEIAKRNIIITSGASIYSNMFARVLNKRYALNVDKTRFQKVIFLASKFYMINLLGMDDTEMTFNYAARSCPNPNPQALKELSDMIPEEAYTDLSTFLTNLSRPELMLGLNDLSIRGYLESFITMYDPSALLALESFPYFMYNIISVVNGAYLNQQYVLEDIVEKHGARMYADLLTFNR